MLRKVPDYWETDAYKKNAETNSKNVIHTITDLHFEEKKIMVCGRGSEKHPDFYPRFSTPTTNLDSTLYVSVDHSPHYGRFVTRNGNYALSIIVHPSVAEKVLSLGGNIYWFSPEYFDYVNIPKIFFGKNSGLAAIALASYFGANYILLSGIKLTDQYSQFLDGKKIVFEEAKRRGTRIFSLDGSLSETLTYEEWLEL